MVSGGRAWIEDGSAGGDVNKGMYNFVNDGDVVIPVTTSHATNYRVDRVVAIVEDSEISGSVDAASLQVLAGTPASTLSAAQDLAPAVPVGAIDRGTVVVGPSVTSITNANITNNTTTAQLYAEMSPGVAVVTSSTRPTGSDRVTGMYIFETDTLRTWQWNGTAWLFRGGNGPRAFVSRGGAWVMATTASYLTTLDPATGSNFETAYYTFVDSSSSTTGDRIRVKQEGLYTIEMFINMSNFSVDYFADVRTEVVTGSLGLPSTATTHAPRASGQFVKGRAIEHHTRTIYLPTGAELAWRYDAGTSSIQVAEFWSTVTLIG